MKKVMFVLAAIAMAMSAQAACVTWNSAMFQTPGSGGTGYSGSAVVKGATGYSAVVNFFMDALGTEAVSGVTGNTSTTVGMTIGLSNMTSDSFSSGGTYYAQLVITYGDSELKSDIAAFTMPAPGSADANLTINFNTGDGFLSKGSKYPTTGWKSAGSDVPEPTSGLLMLVGASLLALRRRRA